MALDTFTTTQPEKTDTERDRLGKIAQAMSSSAGGTTSGTPTHIHGTIATGGTAQQLQEALARQYFYVRNTSAGNLRITYEGTAPSVSVGQLLEPGEAYEAPPNWCPQDVVKIWGAVTGQTYEAIVVEA